MPGSRVGVPSEGGRHDSDRDQDEGFGPVSHSDVALGALFVAAAAISLGSSWVLVSRIERLGALLALSAGLLGMLAALAADAPEVTAAASALASHHSRVGAGVVLGSNVFNLAALLGLPAVAAGRIPLHRRVILLEGVVAVWVAAVCVALVTRVVSATLALVLVLDVLAPYVLVLSVRPERLRRIGLPPRFVRWLRSAIHEEELELEAAVHQPRGGRRDLVVALVAVAVVVAASIAMERSASKIGARHGVSEIVVGALVLAAVTSLPNAVSALYLASRGRGQATLSIATNSNALNVVAGLILPAIVLGFSSSAQTTLVAASYLGLTVAALLGAYVGRGLGRGYGVLLVSAYVVFAAVVLAGGS